MMRASPSSTCQEASARQLFEMDRPDSQLSAEEISRAMLLHDTLTLHTDYPAVLTNIGVVKHWSLAQSLVALSSCEAEWCTMHNGAAEAIGIKRVAADVGDVVQHWES